MRDARDAALALAQRRYREGRRFAGCELDDAARAVIVGRGFGPQFIHRTGHSLGPQEHWIGGNLDGFETQDSRALVPGVGFTIEPGIYLPGELGVRLEIDVFWGKDGPVATTPVQRELPCLG